MANRLLFGNRSGQYGLFVSKPGYNVLSAADQNLLFSTGKNSWQIVQSGQFSLPNATTTTFTFPNLGYYPCIIAIPNIVPAASSSDGWYFDFSIKYNSFTSAEAYIYIGGAYNYTGVVTYAVMRVPYTGPVS